MRSPTRTELIRLIEQMSDAHPNWRMGQMLANMAGWSNSEIWDVEDDQLLSSAQSHLERLQERIGSPDASVNEAA